MRLYQRELRLRGCRHLVPCLAVKFPTMTLFLHTTPLLEEERDACLLALVANVRHPYRIHRSSARPGLATDDCPINAAQIEIAEWTDKRFEGEKLNLRACLPQMVNPVCVPLRFDTDAHPDIRRPCQERVEFGDMLCTLRENLEAVPVRALHHIEDALDEFEWHILVEQVAHGIDEDRLRLLPCEWHFQHMLVHRKFEAVCIVRLPHELQAICQPFRIAMLATGTDFRTTCKRIPSGFGPLDVGISSH